MPIHLNKVTFLALLCMSARLNLAIAADPVERQWLFNFDGAGAVAVGEYYKPDASAGELAPINTQPGDLVPDPKAQPQYAPWEAGGIHLLNNSGKARFVTTPDGRKVLELEGNENSGDGLVFEHFRRRRPSRILEAVVAVRSYPKRNIARIISSNDWRMRPLGQIMALGIDPTGRSTVELRMPNAFECYPVADELDSMHRFVCDEQVIPTDGQFHHVATVYDHIKQALYLYVDGKLADATPMRGTEHEFDVYRAIGVSADAMTRNPVNGFAGQIDAVAESTFEGVFQPRYFQLIKADGPEPAKVEYPTIKLTIPPRVFDLSRLPNERIPVFEPRGWDQPTYHHGPLVAFLNNRCIVAWHAAQRSESDSTTGMLSWSDDLKSWSKPKQLGVLPRNLFVQDGTLYLWDGSGTIFTSRNGEDWEETGGRKHPFAGDISSAPFVSDSTYLSVLARERGAGHPFVKLSDGRWMAPVSLRNDKGEAGHDRKKMCAPMAKDPTALSDWSGGQIDVSEAPIVGSSAGWQGADGALHYTSRCGPYLWHASSTDDGKTWTPLLPQPEFSDSPSYKVFGNLPGSREVFYLGNPYPNSRAQLVLATSADGWKFDHACLVRWEGVTPRFPAPHKDFQPGYEGVSATIHEGHLYVVYSVCRERIEMASLDLNKLGRAENGRLHLAGLAKPHPQTAAVPTAVKESSVQPAAPGYRCEWLFNFDGDISGTPSTYTPDPGKGEIAPRGGPIKVVNQSGALAFRRKDGRSVLYVESRNQSGDGLLFEHQLDGHPSRIFEAVVRPARKQDREARLFSLNDWAFRTPGQIRFFGIGAFDVRNPDPHDYDLPFARIDPVMGPFRPYAGPGHYYLRGVEPFTPDDSFRHVALVYEAGTKTLYLYVDGKISKRFYFEAKENEFPIFRGLGLSNWDRTGENGHGFSGDIDAAAESTFTGRFKLSYFQLLKDAPDVSPEPAPFDRKLKLKLPYQLDAYPADEGPALAYFQEAKRNVPKIPSEVHRVYFPNSHRDLCYSMSTVTTWFKGRLYVTWHSGERGEYARYYGGFVSSSEDLVHWTPRVWVPTIPRAMHATEKTLYIWQAEDLTMTEDGINWKTVHRSPENTQLFDYKSNHHYVRLSDGRLMTADCGLPSLPIEDAIKGYRAVVNFTSDPTGMSGWTMGRVDASPCADVGEPAGYEGPDGVLHYIARCGFHIFHSASYDRGQTWTPLLLQPDFPDNASNKEFGTFPGGSVWYVGNPIFGDRRLLVLGISRDGWNFDTYVVRDEESIPNYTAPFKAERPGYEYPTACYQDGKLYIGYSWFREGVEVSVVDVEKLGFVRVKR